MPSITLRPNANGTLPSGYTLFDTVQYISGETAMWQAVSDNNDNSWIMNGNGTGYEIALFKIPTCASAGMPSNATITDVTLYLRGSGNAVLNVYSELYIAATLYPSTVIRFSGSTLTKSYDYGGTNPSTGKAWTQSDINNMQIGIYANSNLSYGTQCMDIWLIVSCTVPSSGIIRTPTIFNQGSTTVYINAAVKLSKKILHSLLKLLMKPSPVPPPNGVTTMNTGFYSRAGKVKNKKSEETWKLKTFSLPDFA